MPGIATASIAAKREPNRLSKKSPLAKFNAIVWTINTLPAKNNGKIARLAKPIARCHLLCRWWIAQLWKASKAIHDDAVKPWMWSSILALGNSEKYIGQKAIAVRRIRRRR